MKYIYIYIICRSKEMKMEHSIVVCFVYALAASTFIQESVSEKAAFKNASSSNNRLSNTAVFPVGGSVYPDGHFYTQLTIGSNPAKKFNLDIDTGSDVTWVKCPDNQGPILRCNDPLCKFVEHPSAHKCDKPTDPCYFDVLYADESTCSGPLVKENVSARLTNQTVITPLMKIGCGYEVKMTPGPRADGILGLGNSKISILSQFADSGLTPNIISHCFDSAGTGGFLFLGDELIQRAGDKIVWAPMSTSRNAHYSLEHADLLFDSSRKVVITRGLQLIIDTGSTYTYLNAQTYEALLTMIETNIDPRLQRVQDATLPVCWKGPREFRSVRDFIPFFKNLAFRFPGNIVMEMPPPTYLILSHNNNACLGILKPPHPSLSNINLIGDISLLDKVMAYDNQKKRIGWFPYNCAPRRNL